MNTYLVRTNTKTMKSSVHSRFCQVGVSKAKGYTSFRMLADSAAEAAKAFNAENELETRGLPLAIVCSCAK